MMTPLTGSERLKLILKAEHLLCSDRAAVQEVLEMLEADALEQEKEEWARKKYPELFAPPEGVTSALAEVSNVLEIALNNMREALRKYNNQGK